MGRTPPRPPPVPGRRRKLDEAAARGIILRRIRTHKQRIAVRMLAGVLTLYLLLALAAYGLLAWLGVLPLPCFGGC